MESLSRRKDKFQMPDLEEANARIGLRPVLEEKNRRKANRHRGVEGERGKDKDKERDRERDRDRDRNRKIEQEKFKEKGKNDFSIYDNAHRLIEQKVTNSLNMENLDRKKMSMSPVKRARQALATEPDDGLDSGSKNRKDSSDDDAASNMISA